MQVFFKDDTELFLDSRNKVIVYFDKQGDGSELSYLEAQMTTNKDLQKRLQYVRESLVKTGQKVTEVF